MKRSDTGIYKGIATLLAAALGLAGNIAHAQSAAFTYQGWLNDAGTAANGIYQMRFTMHAAETGGGILGGPLTETAVTVSNGLFAATLDFGDGIYNGNRRWLEIAVATNGSADFTVLTPRQEIRPAPYAVRAGRLDGTLGPHALTGNYSESVQFVNPANVFAGDGGGLSNVQALTLDGLSGKDFWQVGGNSGTSNHFVGTIDAQPLELRVNNTTALRLEPAMNGMVNVIGGNGGGAYGTSGGTMIGGGSANAIYESFHASISGGSSNTVGSGLGEYYKADFAFIGGGVANRIQDGACSVIAGGAENQLEPFTEYSTLSGGHRNTIGVTSRTSSIGGGEANQVAAGPFTATEGVTIAGGSYNAAEGQNSAVGGGEANQIRGKRWGTISGGARNRSGAQASAIGGGTDNYIYGDDFPVPQSPNATIGGGNANLVLFGAANATIAGGRGNAVTGSDASNFRAAAGTIGGGMSNLVSSPFGTIPGGSQAAVQNYGQMAYASGSFGAAGDAQTSTYVCRGSTSDETQVDLFLDGVSRRISLPPNSTWTFEILVSGRAASGNSAAYRIWGAAKNHEGVTTLFGKLERKTIAEDDATWDATASALGIDSTLAVRVTGAKDTPIRWVATVTTSEVTY